AAPHLRALRQVLAPRPLVFGEQHRAVLDTDLDAALLGQLHDGLPGSAKAFPVVVDRAGPIAADEAVHHWNAEQVRGFDNLADMARAGLCFGRVGAERVGVVAESADGETGCGHFFLDRLRPGAIEPRDIEVSYAGITPFRLPGGPAHQLHALVSGRCGEGEDFIESEIGKYRAYESEF